MVNKQVFETGAQRDVETGKTDYTLLDWGFVRMAGDRSSTPFNVDEYLVYMLTAISARDCVVAWVDCVQHASQRVIHCFHMQNSNLDKPPAYLISGWHPELLRRFADWLTKGAIKYSAHNWRKGIPFSRYYRACWRHWVSYCNGETVEGDGTDVDHLAAVLFNLMGMWVLLTDDNTPDSLLDFDNLRVPANFTGGHDD